MADLRFEYKDGRIVSAVIDFEGPNDFRVGLSGIDEQEKGRLLDAFRKADPTKLQQLQHSMRDGLNIGEKSAIADEIMDAMGRAGVSGRITYMDGNIEYVHENVVKKEPVGAVAGAAVGAGAAAVVQGAAVGGAGSIAEQFTKAFYEATRIDIDGLIVNRNQITSFSPDGKELRMNLLGLSEGDAHELELYLAQHPEQAKAFTQMLQAVGEDLKITDAERALVNNDTEQLLVKAGVSADVVPESITAGLTPTNPKMK
jgi:hypothetical protein